MVILMERDLSDPLKGIVKGLEKISNPSCASGFALGETTLLIINGQGKKVTGGRMPYNLRQGVIEGRCVRKKRKSGEYGDALRLRLTHEGTENSGLVERSTERRETYLYDHIVAAYRIK